MDIKDHIPDVAGPSIKPLEEWKSPNIIINGNHISVQDYLQDPYHYNSQPITTAYWNHFLNTLCLKSRNHISNFTPQKMENPNG